MKERINATIDYEVYKNIQKYHISNLSSLINKLLRKHFIHIENLILTLEEKGYSKDDILELLENVNG